MIGRLYDRMYRGIAALAVVFGLLSFAPQVSASPFGQGVFGADVPFGSETSMAIALGGNATVTMTPSGGNFVGSGSHTITVTSTDVVGYSLYIYATGGTSMTNGAASIPASANGTPSTLATNSWGYNIDASSNYQGITSAPKLLKTASGPYKTGDNTTVTYGVLTDATKAAGNYTVSVTYTAVALTQ